MIRRRLMLISTSVSESSERNCVGMAACRWKTSDNIEPKAGMVSPPILVARWNATGYVIEIARNDEMPIHRGVGMK